MCTYHGRFFGAGISVCSVSTPTQDELLLCRQEAAGARNMQQEQAEAGRGGSYTAQESQETPRHLHLFFLNVSVRLHLEDKDQSSLATRASCVVSEIVACMLA